jgi:DNA-binding MarR family transcriptional regulator
VTGRGGQMSSTAQDEDNQRIMLGLLQSVERDGGQSQRRLAAELGIALGLVNAYLKRCVKKGLVKVSEAPARRYAYYLTPHGFAEKSRLTVEYLGYSFSFFRQARADCAEIFSLALSRGFQNVVVAGVSDLAEIARICALESGVEIVAIVDAKATSATFVGVPVVRSFAEVEGGFDAIVVTDLGAAQATCEAAAAVVGLDRVLAPKLLGVRARPADGAAP